MVGNLSISQWADVQMNLLAIVMESQHAERLSLGINNYFPLNVSPHGPAGPRMLRQALTQPAQRQCQAEGWLRPCRSMLKKSSNKQ